MVEGTTTAQILAEEYMKICSCGIAKAVYICITCASQDKGSNQVTFCSGDCQDIHKVHGNFEKISKLTSLVANKWSEKIFEPAINLYVDFDQSYTKFEKIVRYLEIVSQKTKKKAKIEYNNIWTQFKSFYDEIMLTKNDIGNLRNSFEI